VVNFIDDQHPHLGGLHQLKVWSGVQKSAT
jgi:hypothetical protein